MISKFKEGHWGKGGKKKGKRGRIEVRNLMTKNENVIIVCVCVCVCVSEGMCFFLQIQIFSGRKINVPRAWGHRETEPEIPETVDFHDEDGPAVVLEN